MDDGTKQWWPIFRGERNNQPVRMEEASSFDDVSSEDAVEDDASSEDVPEDVKEEEASSKNVSEEEAIRLALQASM